MPHLNRPLYESLPAAYAVLGAALLWLSYRYREDWWSTTCALAGFAGVVVGLMIWMHRRDYRETGVGYRNRGQLVVDREEGRASD